MNRVLLVVVLAGLTACGSCKETKADPPAIDAKAIQDAEARAMERSAEEPTCADAVQIFSGVLTVDATDYMDEEPIADLDKVLTDAKSVKFTLDYPFEKPFAGEVKAPVTLRKVIDGVRGGFRTMYEGAAVKEIPGMMNKDVRGKYGNSFHAIGDLVIEEINLCAGDTLGISIGS